MFCVRCDVNVSWSYSNLLSFTIYFSSQLSGSGFSFDSILWEYFRIKKILNNSMELQWLLNNFTIFYAFVVDNIQIINFWMNVPNTMDRSQILPDRHRLTKIFCRCSLLINDEFRLFNRLIVLESNLSDFCKINFYMYTRQNLSNFQTIFDILHIITSFAHKRREYKKKTAKQHFILIQNMITNSH